MDKFTYFYELYSHRTRLLIRKKLHKNMTEKESALYSHYIIDGVRLDMTPAELLDECMDLSEEAIRRVPLDSAT